MDSLLAFWPGIQVLKGDLKGAIEIHEMLYQVIKVRRLSLSPVYTIQFVETQVSSGSVHA